MSFYSLLSQNCSINKWYHSAQSEKLITKRVLFNEHKFPCLFEHPEHFGYRFFLINRFRQVHKRFYAIDNIKCITSEGKFSHISNNCSSSFFESAVKQCYKMGSYVNPVNESVALPDDLAGQTTPTASDVKNS